MRILRGDRDGALPLLERAVELGTRDVAILTEVARTYRLRGRTVEAIRLLAPVVHQGSEPAARREVARSRLDAGEYEAALAESTALIEEIDLSTLQGHELTDLMDVYEIGAEAARGVGDSIRAGVLYGALQSVLLRHNRRDLAEQMRNLEQQRAREFAARRAVMARAEEVTPDVRSGDLLVQARRYLESGCVFAALDAAYDAMALDSINLRPFLAIAESYVVSAQPAAATTLLHSVQDVAHLRQSNAELAPVRRLLGRIADDPTMREQAAERLLEQGDIADAAAEFWDLAEEASRRDPVRADTLYRRVLDIDPERAPAALALAEVLYQDGKEQEALAIIATAADRRQAAGSPDAATEIWAAAVKRLPELAGARRAYGERLWRRGRPASGARELIWAADIAAGRGDTDVDSLLRAAQIFDELDDLPAALRTYDRLMRRVPGNAQVQEHFVGFCLRRGRRDLAGRTLRALAEFLLTGEQRRSPAEAVAALTQLMVLQQDDPWAYERLAAILMEEGRAQDALKVYRQLAVRRPDDEAVRERLQALSGSMGASARDLTTGG